MDQGRISEVPQHFVQPPQTVPPGLVQQPQQAQGSTPLGAAGQFFHPSQQQRPQTALPSAPQSVHGGSFSVPPPQPMTPRHPMGLNLHPTQQSMPQMVPPAAQQSVHGGTPIAPASPSRQGSAWEQDHVSEVNATPSASNGQASRASRKRAQQNRHVPRGADMSHQHIEAFNERFSDLRVKEVMEATAEHQFVYTEPNEEDIDRALRESIKKLEEDEMAKFTKERDQIRATVAENVRQGGGSRRGAGGANPQAKQSSSASCASSRNTPVSSDPPGARRAVTTPQKDVRARVASASGMSDEDVGGVTVEEQPAAPEVDLDRRKSPMRSPPRSRRHVRRDDAAQRAGSPLHRSNARRWRGIGAEMYYASGRYESGPDGAKFRSKHRGA